MGKFRDYFVELTRTEEFPQLTLFPVFVTQKHLAETDVYYLLARYFVLTYYLNFQGIDQLEFNAYLYKYGAAISKLKRECTLLEKELKNRAKIKPKEFKRALKKLSKVKV